MKYFNKTNIKEGILWCLFFTLTFFVGYFHGSSPESQLSYHYSEIKNIDLLTMEGQILPSDFISYIEKETHSQIKIIAKKTYDEFRTELIINKNIALIFTPENFVQPLFKDNRIRNIEILKEEIEKQIHFDFIPKSLDGKIYSLPAVWFINVFSIKKEKPQTFQILKHTYLENVKKLNPKWNITAKPVIISYRNITDSLNPNDFTELTIQQAEKNKIPYQLDNLWSQLMVSSFVIPNNTPDKDLSFKILRLFLTDIKAKGLFQKDVYGYTWKEFNTDFLTIYNSPESLRNINFNQFNPNYTVFDEKYWKN